MQMAENFTWLSFQSVTINLQAVCIDQHLFAPHGAEASSPIFSSARFMKPRSAFQKPGVLPRSFNQLIEKLRRSFDPNAEAKVVEEFQTSRTQTIASLRYLLLLIVVPLLLNQMSKTFVIEPLVSQFWQSQPSEIFLNAEQEEKLLKEFRHLKDQTRFAALLGESPKLSPSEIQKKFQAEAVVLAQKAKTETIDAISNIFANLLAAIAFIALIIKGKNQLSVLKQFLGELTYGLSDSAKAFILILVTDMFVGFHSAYGWEVLLKNALGHFGLPENRQFISLFIATVPVILDAIGKYWVFRYLNRMSPSSVATYREMNE